MHANFCTYFINEVCSFDIPTFWDLIFSYVSLLCQDSIPDLFSTLSLVWSSAEHALPGDDTHCKIVCSNAVIVFAHNFGSHVAWGSTSFIRIVGVWDPFSGYSKICQFQISIFVKYKILGLNISMDDVMTVDRLKSVDEASAEELSLFLRKSSLAGQVVSEVATQKQVHHQIEVL